MVITTILDSKRQKLLPYFHKLPSQFYLAGGTGLALQLGHRLSDDFDFFCQEAFDTQQLYEQLTDDIFTDCSLTIVQESTNTLDVLTENQIKLSFIRYRYPLQYKLIETEFFLLADLRDIAPMKVIAANQRATPKDYFDLYCLLEKVSLKEIFEVAEKKYPQFNPILYLKGLTYFEDCDTAKPKMIHSEISFEQVQEKLIQEANQLFEHYRRREQRQKSPE